MSLSLALNTALSGLNINQRSLSVLSQNIANANNPEYSRKVISQEAIYLQGDGAGVTISDIGRKVDDYLQRSVISQGSIYGKSEVISNYTDRIQSLLGNPGSANSIYSYTSSFFNALQTLSQTPENASLRTSAVSVGQQAAGAISNLAQGIYDLQFAVDQELRNATDTINGALREIYVLNATISSNKLLGRSTSELEDSRDTKLKDISSLMDIQTFTQSNGTVNIFAAGGYSMLDENLYQLSYNAAPSADFFKFNSPTAPLLLYRIDEKGQQVGSPSTLVTPGVGSAVTSVITGGKIRGLLELRDQQMPDVLQKLDEFAGTLRDEINAVHNSGVPYPGAAKYTGTRLVGGEDFSQWTGSIRIAVLTKDGQPVPSNYSDESGGLRPLTLDLSKLNTGNSTGYPSVQGIINEINRYYGVPGNKVEVGGINDIRLVLNNDAIPGATPQLNFDFKIDNLSGTDAEMFVTDVQVFNDSNTDITNITQDVPQIELAPTSTYTTYAASNTVTVKTAGTHDLVEGQLVYLTEPGVTIDGIAASNMGGYFRVSNITSTGFDITTATSAVSGGAHDVTSMNVRGSYATAVTGENRRTTEDGTITANIAGNTTSNFYTVKAKVSVTNKDGSISTSTVTYRIDNLKNNTRNTQYTAQAATEDGVLVTPNTVYPAVVAKLVNANGVELPIINGAYSTTEKGYLQITGGNSSYLVAIDSLDTAEGGRPNAVPPVASTDRSFAHYFELNNFFASNRTSNGVVDDVKGSAVNLTVSKNIMNNVDLISLGTLARSPQPTDPLAPPLYTYVRNIGDNTVISRMAEFATKIVDFDAAGDLGETSLSFTAYAGQLISTVSTKASNNKSAADNAKLLLDGFSERADGVRGVNLDEELANTIIYQNAYAASARIITVANNFFDSLMDAVR